MTQGEILSGQNVRLRQLLKQAGMDAAARDITDLGAGQSRQTCHVPVGRIGWSYGFLGRRETPFDFAPFGECTP